MDWKHVRIPFQQGLMLTTLLQQAFMSAYVAHLAAGRGLLPEAAIFSKVDPGYKHYDFYVTPQAVSLLDFTLQAFNFEPSEAPERQAERSPRGLSLMVGEAGAWRLVNQD